MMRTYDRAAAELSRPNLSKIVVLHKKWEPQMTRYILLPGNFR